MESNRIAKKKLKKKMEVLWCMELDTYIPKQQQIRTCQLLKIAELPMSGRERERKSKSLHMKIQQT